MQLTHERVAAMLGVSRVRVTQLKTAGELTDFSPDGVKAFKAERERRKAARQEFKEARRAQQQEERAELHRKLDAIEKMLLLLLGATTVQIVRDETR